MAAKEFPPERVRAIVAEVAGLLKESGESVSVAETVGLPAFRSSGHSYLAILLCEEALRDYCISLRGFLLEFEV